MEGSSGKAHCWSPVRRLAFCLTLLLLIAPAAGCVVGLPAQIGYMLWGLRKPAEYDGLKNQRVALVCYSSTNQGTEEGLRLLTSKIHYELGNNVKKVKMVPNSEVRDYIPYRGISERELLEVGRGVSAEKLVAVKIHSYTLFPNSTLYRGFVTYTVTVYDMEDNGKQVWTSGKVDYEYPKNGGVPEIETREDVFQTKFIDRLGGRIARLFFDFDMVDDFAEEDTLVE